MFFIPASIIIRGKGKRMFQGMTMQENGTGLGFKHAVYQHAMRTGSVIPSKSEMDCAEGDGALHQSQGKTMCFL